METTKSNFGDSLYQPRITDESLIGFAQQKKLEKEIKESFNFFDNDIASQATASLMVSPQNQSVTNRGITWNIPLLEQTYRSSPYLKRAIQWRSSNLLLKGVDINSDDNELTSIELSIIQQMISNRYYRPLVKMFRYGELYGGSACIKVVKGKTKASDLEKPYRVKDLKQGDFLGLKPLTRWYSIEPALEKGLVSEVDEEKGIHNAEEIGQPLYYRVNFSGGLSGFSGNNHKEMQQNGLKIQGKSYLVHRSWLYIYNPYQLGHIETQVERYWSQSLMEVASKDLNRHEILWTATAKSAVKNNMAVFKIHGLDNSVRSDRNNKIINESILGVKSTTNQGIIAIGDKDDFVFASGDVQGNVTAITQSMRHISLAFGTPINILFQGSDQYDEGSYLQILSDLEDIQKSEVAPIIDDLIRTLAMHLFGKELHTFSFEFKSIMTLTPKAKAEIIKIMIEALVMAHGENLIDTYSAIEMLPDILNNPSNIFSHLNPKYIDMIKKGGENGEPITSNWFKRELAEALNQMQDDDNKGISGVESPESSSGRVNEGGNPTKSDRGIKRHALNPTKGKV